MQPNVQQGVRADTLLQPGVQQDVRLDIYFRAELINESEHNLLHSVACSWLFLSAQLSEPQQKTTTTSCMCESFHNIVWGFQLDLPIYCVYAHVAIDL